MFDVDLFDARDGEINAGVIGRLHAKGAVVVCYMDSGAWESYRPDASKFPASVIGNSTGWSGERWLDIRPQSWPLIEPIIVERMKLAVSLGCDGIEPDQNNPVGNNPGFAITYADEKAWYLEVARQAHALGLSVGMSPASGRPRRSRTSVRRCRSREAPPRARRRHAEPRAPARRACGTA